MALNFFPTTRYFTLAYGILAFFPLLAAHAEDSAKEEKPKDAFVKIFNASFRKGVETWETGLDLKFHDAPLANDVRVGESGLVRQITYKIKDTVDVFRHRKFLKNPPPDTSLPAAKISATFDQGSVTLLVVHGEVTPAAEQLKIDTIREFPVPEESRRLGMARLLVANFRQENSVFLSIGSMETFELPYDAYREIFIAPEETEIFLIHRESEKTDFKRQLTVFQFKADHNYTVIICPSAETPSRPVLRISDSNQDWKELRSAKHKGKRE